MFKYVVATNHPQGDGSINRLINFSHVREIGPLFHNYSKEFFSITFADGTITYGLGADQYEEVSLFVLNMGAGQ